MRKLTLVLISLVLFTSCTKQQRSRALGGEEKINLPANRKLLNITWKETDLWILTRQMRVDDVPEIYTFEESSSYGIFEGRITINESMILDQHEVIPVIDTTIK